MSGGLGMDGFIDMQEAVDAELKHRLDKIEKLSTFSAFAMLAAATWLAWPALQSAMEGGPLLTGLGYSLIILVWGIFVQDLGILSGSGLSRIGAAVTIAWLPLLVIGIGETEGNSSELIGAIIIIVVGLILLKISRNILSGDIAVMKFRAIMGFLGVVLAASLLATADFESNGFLIQIGSIGIGVMFVGLDWFGNDENRALRKEFDTRLNKLETRILRLKSQGSAVDQAASLVMTAREEGHRDPDWGMKLLDEADDDIERSLSLADDVEIIKNDALQAVETAEEIAPIVKRPRKAWDMGQREVELGSLREGEALFRQAKKRAMEVIEWWEKAEEAIREASALLSNSKHEHENLHEILQDARKKLHSENPKKAYEFAMVIPNQLDASDDAMKIAEEAVKEAVKQLKAADGIDKSLLDERMEKAHNALDSGDHGQAKGLADGVVREIIAEREAMDDVRRGLRQKSHLTKKWKDREDASDWDARLQEIEEATDQLQWTHAAVLLERLTKDLDSEGKATDEADELLEFVRDEWKTLRNQCEASSIKVDDPDRSGTEEAIGIADEAIKAGRTDEALEALGLADEFMEKLRRRV